MIEGLRQKSINAESDGDFGNGQSNGPPPAPMCQGWKGEMGEEGGGGTSRVWGSWGQLWEAPALALGLGSRGLACFIGGGRVANFRKKAHASLKPSAAGLGRWQAIAENNNMPQASMNPKLLKEVTHGEGQQWSAGHSGSANRFPCKNQS